MVVALGGHEDNAQHRHHHLPSPLHGNTSIVSINLDMFYSHSGQNFQRISTGLLGTTANRSKLAVRTGCHLVPCYVRAALDSL